MFTAQLCCTVRHGGERRGREEGGNNWWQLVAETPRANPINLLILLFLALGYVFLPNTESIQAKCGRVSGAGNVFSLCQNRGVG